jgi:hypothetical protein
MSAGCAQHVKGYMDRIAGLDAGSFRNSLLCELIKEVRTWIPKHQTLSSLSCEPLPGPRTACGMRPRTLSRPVNESSRDLDRPNHKPWVACHMSPSKT